ncbi:MAG: hypothetical protein ACK55Z_15105, partial [bacterium]
MGTVCSLSSTDLLLPTPPSHILLITSPLVFCRRAPSPPSSLSTHVSTSTIPLSRLKLFTPPRRTGGSMPTCTFGPSFSFRMRTVLATSSVYPLTPCLAKSETEPTS